MSGNPDKLDGWGAIELYLGVTRKAVLRRGYPLHYYLTGKVYALKSEFAAHEAALADVGRGKMFEASGA
jgi:hypothetical protein